MQVGENVSHYLLQHNVNPRRIRRDVAEDKSTKSQKTVIREQRAIIEEEEMNLTQTSMGSRTVEEEEKRHVVSW